MKFGKITACLLVTSLILTVFACSKPENNTENTTDKTTDETFKSDYADIKLSDYIILGKYKGYKIEVTDKVLTNQMIKDEINTLLENYATYDDITDRKIVNDGDTIVVDYKGLIDGEEFDGGTATDSQITIGKDSFIDGFIEGIIGKTVGEEFTLNLKFPDDYGQTDLNGKAVNFVITVNKIQKKVLPEFNDEFVQNNFASDYNSAEDLLTAIKTYYESSLDSQEENEYQLNLIEKIIDNCELFKIPDSIKKTKLQAIEDSVSQYASMYGMTNEAYFTYYYGYTPEEYVTLQIKSDLITLSVIEKEGYTLSDGEYEQGLADYVEQYEYDSPEAFEEAYGKDAIKFDLLNAKVSKIILNASTKVIVTASSDETTN